MIRRDYILRIIEECIRALARIASFKRSQQWDEAASALDAEFQRLTGAGAQAVARLSETELLARLIEGEGTQAVRHKTLILTTLLKEAGDVAAGQNRPGESRECYLKALHLLLDTLARGEDLVFLGFVPKVEMLLAALREQALPMRTQGLLLRHYERTGDFAKAEDALFVMLEAEPDNAGLVEFGLAFYQRVLAHSDAVLSASNLPRVEAEQGLKELQRRQPRGE